MYKLAKNWGTRISKKAAPYVWSLLGSGLKSTRVFESASDPEVEFHTMLGNREDIQFIIGLKSLLRYVVDCSYSVVVHSDGSLGEKQHDRLRRHFPGIRIISPDFAEQHCRRVLGSDSFAYRQRSVYLSWRRLVDTQVFRQADKIISIDSDVLCLNPPTDLLRWIRDGERPFLIGQTNGAETPARIAGDEWYMTSEDDPQRLALLPIQTRFLRSILELSESIDSTPRFLDGGCAGVHGHRQELNLNDVEKVVRKAQELGLDMSEWGAEQCTVVLLLSCRGANRLDPLRNFNFFPTCVDRLNNAEIVHFVGLARYYRWIYPRIGMRILSELKK